MSSGDPTGGAVLNVGDLAKPITILIEKISDAVGGIAKPWQIARIAKAEGKADLARANTRIEISELEERALQRMVREEGKRQENIESITNAAIPLLSVDAKPDQLENDWLTHFFDRGRIVSDSDMQRIWAAMLAGQANSPGNFSRRTVDLVSTLDKADADLFIKLLAFVWYSGELLPLMFDTNEINGFDPAINFAALSHLEALGLVRLETTGYVLRNVVQEFQLNYFGKLVTLRRPPNQSNFQTGNVRFTAAGNQLARICSTTPNPVYYDSIISRWIDHQWLPSEPVSNTITSGQWYWKPPNCS